MIIRAGHGGQGTALEVTLKGNGVAQSVEHATSGQEVVCLIPAPGPDSLLVGSVSV